MFQWQVTPEEEGMAALAWLQHRLPRAPAGYLRRLLVQGRIGGPEGPIAPDDPLREGDLISLPGSRRLERLLDDLARDVTILEETSHFLAIDKPSGLPVHRGADPSADNLADRVRTLLDNRRERYAADPVHRLDLATSGPVLFGKGRKAKARLGRLFMDNRVEKSYLALVAGLPPSPGRWTAPVRAKGKWREAETAYDVLGRRHDFSLVEVRPRTGRTHQIRQHFADAGYPLAGDRRYGGPEIEGLPRLFLHCRSMIFTDPWTGTVCRISSPLPSDLMQVLDRLGLAPEDPDPGSPGAPGQPNSAITEGS